MTFLFLPIGSSHFPHNQQKAGWITFYFRPHEMRQDSAILRTWSNNSSPSFVTSTRVSKCEQCQTQAKPSQEPLTNPPNPKSQQPTRYASPLAGKPSSTGAPHHPPSSSSPWPTPFVRRKPNLWCPVALLALFLFCSSVQAEIPHARPGSMVIFACLCRTHQRQSLVR